MHLEIISHEKVLFSGPVRKVDVPGCKGVFQVLPNHAPIISALCKGVVKVFTQDRDNVEIPVSGGIVEVNRDLISVLVH